MAQTVDWTSSTAYRDIRGVVPAHRGGSGPGSGGVLGFHPIFAITVWHCSVGYINTPVSDSFMYTVSLPEQWQHASVGLVGRIFGVGEPS